MDNTVSMIDLVILMVSLASGAIAIGCALYCHISTRSYMDAQQVLGQSMQELHDLIGSYQERVDECEEAYLDVIRNIYRIDKTVGAIAGDAIGVNEDGDVDDFAGGGDR